MISFLELTYKDDKKGAVTVTKEETKAADSAGSSPGCGTADSSPADGKGGLGQLLAFAGERRWMTYAGCVGSAVSMLLSFGPYVCIWFAARDLIAVAPAWENAVNLASYGMMALAFAIASILVYFCSLMLTHLAAFRCASNIRKQTTEHLMRASLGYFDSHASGALRRVVDGCAMDTEGLLAHKLPDTAGSIAMIVGMLVLFFAFDWRLGLACLVSVALSVVCLAKMMGGHGMDFMTRYMDALVKMNKTGTEYVRGIPVLKVFQQSVYSFKAFYEAIEEYTRLAQDYAVEWCQKPQSLSLTAINGVAAFLVPMAVLLAPGEADLAHFVTNVAFYAIFSAVIPTAMTRVMFMSDAVQTSQDALNRVNAVLAAPVIEGPSASGRAAGRVTGVSSAASASPATPRDNGIEFDDVTFTYEGADAPALDHVSLRIPAGSTVALVGPSGGGKTTAASLVPRFWDVDKGAVRMGGVDVRDLDPADLMDRVAFVFQSNRLFKQSILDNVRAARPTASREEVAAALAAAQCDDIIAKFPRGMDTVVGSDGVYLSGGEVQRIMIARAILKDAPVVVLDEATAFADPENEVKIQAAFKHLAASSDGTPRTVLMVAHRLSTVVGADLIAVLDRGRVVEQGAHGQLLAAGGLYARMWADYERAAAWKIANDGDGADGAGDARAGECGAGGGTDAADAKVRDAQRASSDPQEVA